MATVSSSAPARLLLGLLRRQDDVCSAAVVRLLQHSKTFAQLSRNEGDAIVRRDHEDDTRLAAGIAAAVASGTLPPSPPAAAAAPAIAINVVGLTAQQVTEKILSHLPTREGNVIVLQGLSGTGKGTTVAKLKELLPRCVTWSNGNVFRCYTYLCAQTLEGEGKPVCGETLTPELIARVAARVSFERVDDDHYDTLLDHTLRVRDIENTLLKTPAISERVPVVAERTQGEVIRFGAAAVQQLSAAGYNVVLEGRAQTLNYIATPHRFELVIPDVATLGQRRAAQRVMAKSLELVRQQQQQQQHAGNKKATTAGSNGNDDDDDSDVAPVVLQAVELLA